MSLPNSSLPNFLWLLSRNGLLCCYISLPVFTISLSLSLPFSLQLGLLQACDWLLSLKVNLWENHKNEDGFAEELRPGFYQDLETLSKLVTLLPSARARVSGGSRHSTGTSVASPAVQTDIQL